MKTKNRVYTECICGSESKIWFVDGTFNILYSIGLEDGSIHSIIIPYKESFQHALYSKTIKIGNEIWLIPLCAHRLVIYNIIEESFRCIDFSKEREKFKYLFCDYVIDNGFIYLMPSMYPAIVKISIEKKCVCNECSMPQELNGTDKFGMGGIISVEENNHFMALLGSAKILSLNTKYDKTSIYELGIKGDDGYIPYLCQICNKCYMVLNKQNETILYEINIKEKSIVAEQRVENGWFVPYCIFDEYIVLESCGKQFYEVFDQNLKNQFKSQIIDISDIGHPYDGGTWSQIGNDMVVRSDNISNSLTIFKKGDYKNQKMISINVDKVQFMELMRDYSTNFNSIVFENCSINIDTFVEIVKKGVCK